MSRTTIAAEQFCWTGIVREPEIRHAILEISFRAGAEDAPYLVQEFHEQFGKVDLLQLPNYCIFIKLVIDGTPSKPFSAVTVPPAQ
jgi:hypothetical protein